MIWHCCYCYMEVFKIPSATAVCRQRIKREFWSGKWSQVALAEKNLPANVGDIRATGSIPGSGIAPGGGHDNPLQYCLQNPMDRGAWTAAVPGITKSWTWLSNCACCRHLQQRVAFHVVFFCLMCFVSLDTHIFMTFFHVSFALTCLLQKDLLHIISRCPVICHQLTGCFGQERPKTH